MRRIAVLCACALAFFPAVRACAQTPDDILRMSDQKLIPAVCSYTLRIQTVDDDGKENVSMMKGYKKGSDRNVMIVEEPKRIAGSAHLRKGGVIWSYYTTDRKLRKIAYQSVFMGSLLSYGDVMAQELSYDYAVSALSRQDKDLLLELHPKQGHEGYARVLLTIDAASYLPRKREYFAESGIMVKSSAFSDILIENGRTVAVEQTFYEPLKARTSVITYSAITYLAKVPDNYYNENYLKDLSGE